MLQKVCRHVIFSLNFTLILDVNLIPVCHDGREELITENCNGLLSLDAMPENTVLVQQASLSRSKRTFSTAVAMVYFVN